MVLMIIGVLFNVSGWLVGTVIIENTAELRSIFTRR